MAKGSGTELIDILLESGHITEEQYRQLVTEHGETGQQFEELVAKHRLVDDEMLVKVRGTILGVPYADLIGKEIDPEVLNLIPREVAENNKAVPFGREEDGTVNIGLTEPRDMQAIQAIDFLARTKKFRPHYHIISQGSYTSTFKKYQEIGKEVEKALEVAKEKLEGPEEPADAKKEERIEEVIKGAPVSRIVSVILRHAYEGGASDIHIEPFGDETRVRYRVDGVLKTSIKLPKYIHPALVARIKVLSNLKLDETRIPQDGRIRETFGDKRIDFRVSTLPLAENEKVVMRILDTTKGVPKLAQLGFRPRYSNAIEQQVQQPHGMFLITGPTGSGKSTTLFTILNMRNEEAVNISTLEDPVEYQIRGVNQAQMRPEVGFTFAAGLRSLLRQDPDIIMVGEIRDGETGELAVHAALTGHLVFSTLHTNDAIGIVPRLTDMHLEPFLLSATMNMAIAQRLARRICERCKTKAEVPEEVMTKIVPEIQEIPASYFEEVGLSHEPPYTFYQGRGCLRCSDSGYTGRVAVAEVIQFNDELKQLIVKGFEPDAVIALLKKMDAINLRQDALLKALEGSTTIEEVMRVTAD